MVRSKFFQEVNQFWRHKILGCAFAQNTNERFFRKRGLSTVVTTLIIILLVLVAIGIIWAVISNLITESSEQIYLDKFTVRLDIQNVQMDNANLNIKIKRNSGKGDLRGINFVIYDGTKTQVIPKETNLEELGEKTFSLNYSGLIKEVSIAPVFKSESGNEIIGAVLDKQIFSNKEMMKNFGGVSWWRFEGNANDEIAGNNGIINGTVDCNVGGKFGKACKFDGVNGSYINVNDDSSLDIANEITISLWLYQLEESNRGGNAITKEGAYKLGPAINSFSNYVLRIETTGGSWYNQSITTNSTTKLNQWVHLVGTYDSSTDTSKIYINGDLDIMNTTAMTGVIETNASDLWIGRGLHPWFNGTIDETIIFNRALTANEVQQLYELDLS